MIDRHLPLTPISAEDLCGYDREGNNDDGNQIKTRRKNTFLDRTHVSTHTFDDRLGTACSATLLYHIHPPPPPSQRPLKIAY